MTLLDKNNNGDDIKDDLPLARNSVIRIKTHGMQLDSGSGSQFSMFVSLLVRLMVSLSSLRVCEWPNQTI